MITKNIKIEIEGEGKEILARISPFDEVPSNLKNARSIAFYSKEYELIKRVFIGENTDIKNTINTVIDEINNNFFIQYKSMKVPYIIDLYMDLTFIKIDLNKSIANLYNKYSEIIKNFQYGKKVKSIALYMWVMESPDSFYYKELIRWTLPNFSDVEQLKRGINDLMLRIMI
jgi:hypothetical protein